MKVKYIEETDPLYCENGKVYEVLSIENGYYRIIDATGEDYLYAPEEFEIVEGNVQEYIDLFLSDIPLGDLMEESLYHQIQYIDKDCEKHSGYVCNYEQPVDSGKDPEGCLFVERDDGHNVLLYDSDLLGIRILDD